MPGSSGHGAKLWVQNGTGAITRIGQIMDVSGPSLQTTDVDVTTNDSPQHTKEYIASLIDAGELGFPVLFSSRDAYETLRTFQINQTTLKVMLLLPSEPNVLVTCSGYVKELSGETPMEEAITNQVTFMVTGVVRFLNELTGDLTLTAAAGADNSGGSGTDRTGQFGLVRASTNAPVVDASDAFGTLAGDDGAVVQQAHIKELYAITTGATAGRGIRLRIEDYDGPEVANEFYMLFDTETMRRQGQVQTAEPTSADDFIIRWGGSIGQPYFSDGQSVAVQLFAA